MKIIRPILATLCLLAVAQWLPAQLSPGSRILYGQASLLNDQQDLFLSLAPGAHYFLSPGFSLGGQLLLSGDFQQGVRIISITPEIRAYFQPEREKSHWFWTMGSRIDLYRNFDNEELIPPFALSLGFGWMTFLEKSLLLESRLLVTFQQMNDGHFFKNPALQWQNTLRYYEEVAGEAVLPATGRGNWMIGGNPVGLEFSFQPFTRNLSIFLSPRAAYFVANRWLIGAAAGISYTRQWTDFVFEEQNFGSSITSRTLGAFVRYYPLLPAKPIRPFVHLGLDHNSSKVAFIPFNSQPPGERNLENTIAILGLGTDIFLSSAVAVEPMLGIHKDLESGRTQVGLSLGLQYFLVR